MQVLFILLPSTQLHFVFAPLQVPVPAEDDFLMSLKAAVEGSRPVRWQKEGPLHLLAGWALLITDHAASPGGSSTLYYGEEEESSQRRGSSVCVEIKVHIGAWFCKRDTKMLSSFLMISMRRRKTILLTHLLASLFLAW